MIPVEVFIREAAEKERPAPVGVRRTMWRTLFGDLASSVITVVIVAIAILALPRLLSWAVVNGVWTGGGDACRDAGACWAYLREKTPFILFGIYPPEEQWRPVVLILIFIGLTLWTMPTAHWTRLTLFSWIAGILLSLLLMGGGLFGLETVPTSAWGGLPITILLTVLSLAIGFPLGTALALGRQSRLPVIRLLSIGFIEVIRGLPVVSLLFIASILLPIMLPDGMTIDNLFRALVALTFSSAAYLAEVLRGGLQGLHRGQEEAARALGLGWFTTMRLVILPQAIRKVIPPLTNTAVVIVKNTSLVLVVGLFDLLSAGRAALVDPDWPAPYVETYMFVALIYFVICFGISRYSLSLERTMVQGVQR
jgi:general L-amino acid transport system permease protein